MKTVFQSYKKMAFAALSGSMLLAACNKELPQATPIIPPVAASTTTIAQAVATTPTFSFLLAAINRADSGVAAGSRLIDLLGNTSTTFTVFAPDDDAMKLSLAALGLPPVTQAFGYLPVAQVRSILQYHIIGGEGLTAARIPTTFPNLYIQSSLILANATPISPRMGIFPSRRANGAWVNTMPVKATDLQLANGVVHTIAGLLLPPSQVIAQIAAANSDLTYLLGAIARADSGVAAGSKLSDALANPLANLTVFAPTNKAFQDLLTGAIYQSLVNQGVPPATAIAQATALASTTAVFTNPALYGALSAQTLKGIVAYHLLGSRAYSVNIASTAAPANTLLVLPGTTTGLTISLTNTAGVVTAKGNANSSAATVSTANINAVNGVVHTIDKVLMPF